MQKVRSHDRVKLWAYAFLKHFKLSKTVNCTELYDYKNESLSRWRGWRGYLTTASNQLLRL